MILIKEKSRCNGCCACYSICPTTCIEMKSDFEGFKYPSVDHNKCIQCGLCNKVCPLISREKESFLEARAYACYNKNEEIRRESSSGGIFTLLAEEILSDNGVVFGAAWTASLKLKHKFLECKEELYELRGSKYLQSEIGNTYNKVCEFLKEGKKVLFAGTPCQIGGLKSFIEKKLPKEKHKNLFTVDFICHGVPSPFFKIS